MNPLFNCVMAAALALGQTSEPPLMPQPGGAPSVSPPSVPPPPTLPAASAAAASTAQQPQRGPIISFFMREDRPVWTKITSWFKREQPETSAPPPPPTTPMPPMKGLLQREPIAAPPATPTPPPSTDFPRRLPNPSSKAPAPTTTPAAEFTGEPTALREFVQASTQLPSTPKADKSPIRAQFVNKIGRDENFEWITGQLEIEKGVYVIYYANWETVDKYHGRIVLQPQQVDMKDLHRGDLVCVRGQLMMRSGLQGSTPAYRLTSVGLIERPKL